MEIDALISPSGADRALYQDFQRLTPFGPGNPEPVFAVADVMVQGAQMMRGGHIRCVLADGAGGKLKAMAWRAEDTDLGRRLMSGGEDYINLILSDGKSMLITTNAIAWIYYR